MKALKIEGHYITIEEMENGNLRITANEDGREYIVEQVIDPNSGPESTILQDMLEDITCNSELEFFYDVSVLGHMCEAPAITDGYYRNDDGEWESHEDAKLWFFNEYMTTSLLELLVNGEEMIFLKLTNA